MNGKMVVSIRFKFKSLVYFVAGQEDSHRH